MSPFTPEAEAQSFSASIYEAKATSKETTRLGARRTWLLRVDLTGIKQLTSPNLKSVNSKLVKIIRYLTGFLKNSSDMMNIF